MWHLAEKRGVAGLNSLDNGTYVDLLNQVSLYYSHNTDVRARLALEKFRGPQSIDDRASVRENYLGNLSKFQFYVRKMMDRILGEAPFFISLDRAAELSERAFMDALQAVKAKMRRTPSFRGCYQTLRYRGPQSYAHRSDASRLKFNFDAFEPPRKPRLAPGLPEASRFLMCSRCGTYRRVDAETRLIFSNKEWMQGYLRADEERMLVDVPDVVKTLEQFLEEVSERKYECVQQLDFLNFLQLVGQKEFFVKAFDRLDDLAEDEPTLLRCFNFLQLFLKKAHGRGLGTYSDGLQGMFEALENALPGVSFTCASLVWPEAAGRAKAGEAVDCCNLAPCDWDMAFKTSHDLSQCGNLSHELLLGYDEERGLELPCLRSEGEAAGGGAAEDGVAQTSVGLSEHNAGEDVPEALRFSWPQPYVLMFVSSSKENRRPCIRKLFVRARARCYNARKSFLLAPISNVACLGAF